MLKKLTLILIALPFYLLADSAVAEPCAKKIVVLIPGFFNVPGFKAPLNFIDYFSKTVVSTVRSNGREPVVLQRLNPLGSIHENSEIVLQDIQNLAQQYPGCMFDVIAHSAGGFYMAQALTQQPNLPVKTVVTVSTPYNGAEMIDLIKWIPGWKTIASWLNFESLKEFDSQVSHQVLAQFVIPEKVHWVVAASSQKSCFLLSCTEARRLSWVLSLAWDFLPDQRGDGVVSESSSLLTQGQLMDSNHQEKQVKRLSSTVFNLEHWELVLEPSLFQTLGVSDTQWIVAQQKNIYSKLLEQLN